ncbi:vanadium-dependent haloperoxidase [Paraglaciecola sp.]|uniref:vanadium-dependent haloperoxidase n=1 Tax=Paraglaciecola sp. TaxID=1920173 RepID=UPI003EF39A0F
MTLTKLYRLGIFLVSCSLLAACGSGGSDGGENRVIIETVQEVVADDRPKSVARMWNEVVLEGIRNDYARPTIHARNLYHISMAMYDAWAAYTSSSSTYMLGKTHNDFSCEFNRSVLVGDPQIAREQALSYAVYRLIRHRFRDSPGVDYIYGLADELMRTLKLDVNQTSRLYSNGSAIGLGNHIADCIINYGMQDGANERINYENVYYQHVNPNLIMAQPGNPDIVDRDRWQPLALIEFIDQAGNPDVGGSATFLGPEWGNVEPFALTDEDKTVYERDGYEYQVYHDPGAPVFANGDTAEEYKWGFSLVAKWSSHLSPDDNVSIDISPASIGNINSYPTHFEQYDQFYNDLQGGDASVGYEVNPITNAPYAEQIVPRGDYARVLAEFWADGPDSETPPGHWFVILNEVADHALFEAKFEGKGELLGSMEWDVKAYFTLAGAMHDSAVAAWGIKGWYDYIRPVSAIRAMADIGQSSFPTQASYHVDGIPLSPGLIELITVDDPLAGDNQEHLGKIKLFAWKGPDYIADPVQETAGVGWILAENWWPYQRPSFVTPPFAGYVSGHSTYSRAAAEVLTALTGSRFFPGGMSGFEIEVNEFLVFEQGPSVNMTLQWATYQDASDQCSLSRIWGGIHPPIDDIRGRLIGEKIGLAAFAKAKSYIDGNR